jgi:hypothetical protein
MNERIERMNYLSNLRRFTEVEYREFDTFMKEINKNWVGCRHCPAQISFGQKVLKKRAIELQNQEPQLQSTITDEEVIPAEVAIETPVEEIEVPVGDVVITSECQKCKKKKENPHKTPRTKK